MCYVWCLWTSRRQHWYRCAFTCANNANYSYISISSATHPHVHRNKSSTKCSRSNVASEGVSVALATVAAPLPTATAPADETQPLFRNIRLRVQPNNLPPTFIVCIGLHTCTASSAERRRLCTGCYSTTVINTQTYIGFEHRRTPACRHKRIQMCTSFSKYNGNGSMYIMVASL